MKSLLRNHKKLALITLLVVVAIAASFTWDTAEELRGRAQAHYDIRHGKYRVLGYGLPAPSRPEYVRLLRERYGVEYQPVAACIVSSSLMKYVAGYNSVSVPAANQKFGHDIFEETCQEAQQNWKRQLQAR